MASKQAKISLGLDLRAFNQSLKEAERSLKKLETLVNSGSTGKGAGRTVGGAGGSRGIGGAVVPRLPGVVTGPANSVASMLSSPLGVMGAVGLGAVAAGIGAAFSRQLEQSKAGLALRSLSGNAIVKGYGSQNYGLKDRYDRGLQIAGAAGKDLTDASLTKFVDSSEKMERAFGISGGQYASTMGTARKAGISDQDKFISGVIGDAVAVKLSGSAVGEYLAQMTGYMESMSKGVDIDDRSLRGMASALGNMEFFKKDPSRIFDALRGIEGAFKDNDPYMQYLSYRSIQGASKEEMSPAGVELRRDMGLFGNKASNEEMAEMRRLMPGLADVYDISGKDAIEGRAKIAFNDYLGRGERTKEGDQIGAKGFAGAMNLNVNQARPIMMDMLKWIEDGKKIEDWKMSKGDEKKYEDAMKTPEDRAADVLSSEQAREIKYEQQLGIFADSISKFTMDGVDKFVNVVKTIEETFKVSDKVKSFFGWADNPQIKAGIGEVDETLSGTDGKVDITKALDRNQVKGMDGGKVLDFVVGLAKDKFTTPDLWEQKKAEVKAKGLGRGGEVLPFKGSAIGSSDSIQAEVTKAVVNGSTSINTPLSDDIKALGDNTKALKDLTAAVRNSKLFRGRE